MYYSVIGILAFLVLVIINYDVLLKKNRDAGSKVSKLYRALLFSILLYYVTDIIWGFFDANKMRVSLFVDTEIYFAALALGLFVWTRYVVEYLNEKTFFAKVLNGSGTVYLASVLFLIVVNIFYPVIFTVGKNAEYETKPARYAILIAQIVLLLSTSLYALIMAMQTKGSKRNRHIIIGMFGLIMLVFISIQIFYPLLPLYAMGYMVGSCLLRSFVIENEKAAYRKELETALSRENMQLEELKTAWNAAYTDPLTGAKSKLAYFDRVEQLDKDIAAGIIYDLAVAVFDVNDLKRINDTMGHDTGDVYICNAFHIICDIFKHSPVYRIGGDEFAAIIEGNDYIDRNDLKRVFNQIIEDNMANGKVIVSMGLSEFSLSKDKSVKTVFERADHSMYLRKEELKSLRNKQ